MGSDDSEEKRYTARDVKETAGLTYRQLNDWESKGAVSGDDQRGEGWRKFSVRDIFALMVCSELRTRFGIPLEKIKYVRDFMHREGADHFRAAAELMADGLSVYLLTDFEETFIMDSDLEFEDLMINGIFRVDAPQGFVFINLNHIVNKLLGTLKEPFELKRSNFIYTQVHKARAAITACTPAEMKILEHLRDKKCEQLTIRLKEGKIKRIEIEGDVPPDSLDDRDQEVGVRKESDFETVILTRHQGRVKARRKSPLPVTEEDNRRVLYNGRVFTDDAKNDLEE